MTGIKTRGIVTAILWIGYLGVLIAGMIELGIWVSLLAFILMIPLVVAMGAVWGLFSSDHSSGEHRESSTEKRKRNQLDEVLRDLSDEDLLRLKRRLEDGTIDDEVLYDRMELTDDGELVSRQ